MEQKSRLVLASFSQTIADTSELTLGGHNIDTVFADSIRKMFGYEGVAILERMQSLNHQTPIQKIFMYIMANNKCLANLQDYMDVVKSIKLNGHDPTPKIFQKEFVELNVVQLFNLIGSITQSGQNWPALYSGFRAFRNELAENGIDFGIISASHSQFILDVFDFYEIEHPLFCITPDDEFNLLGMDWESKNKPSPLLVAKAFDCWSALGNDPEISLDYAKYKSLMIGDDLELDGKMAESAGIPFWHFAPEIGNYKYSAGQRPVASWEQLSKALKQGKLFF